MKLAMLEEYGLFDTDTAFPGKKRSAERQIDCFEIEYFLSATGKALVNGRAYEISPGTVLCAKPGQTRSSILGFSCYYIHFKLPEDSPYRKMLESCPDYYQILDYDAYGHLFESLCNHLLSEGYHPESDFVNARLLELFYYLDRDRENNLNCSETFDKMQNRFLPKALRLIREEYAKPLTLKDLAAAVGYSPNHFHHVFCEVMKKTPRRYLLEERIKHAKLLLAQSEKSFSEIAYECGFSSQSHFCMQFKKITFCTPGEFRRRLKVSYRV